MRTPLAPPAEALRSVSLRHLHSLRSRGPFSFNHPLRRVDEGDGQSARIGAVAQEEPGSGQARAARLEAVLFLAREPLNTRKLAQYANLADGTEARTLIRQLNQRYDEQGRAFRVEELGGGFQLLTRPQFATWLRRLRRSAAELRLSTPALETLAVVAYRQPVCRADIEAIRGVSCGEILRQLMERDQVRISGRSEELGRPYLYSTTKNFLLTFGLRSLDDLPRAKVLRGVGLPKPADAAPELISPSLETTSHKENAVSVATLAEMQLEEEWGGVAPLSEAPRAADDDDLADDDLDELDDEEDDDLDELEEEDDELDEEDDDLDDDFEDDEWEEVDDDLDEEDDDEEWDDEDDLDDLDDDDSDDWDEEDSVDDE